VALLLWTPVCTERALWKFNWFLTDFGYDPELLHQDQVDEKALLNLQGIAPTSHTIVNGRSIKISMPLRLQRNGKPSPLRRPPMPMGYSYSFTQISQNLRCYLIGHAAHEGVFRISGSTTVSEIIAEAGGLEPERDVRFVELGEYLCEVRSRQYWRLERLSWFDQFLEKRFPESRREAYYLLSDGDPRESDADSQAPAPRGGMEQGGGTGSALEGQCSNFAGSDLD
jgi:hypothetical protein